MKNNIFSKTLLTTTAISLCLPGDSYAGLKSQDRLVEAATVQAAQRSRVLAESHAANIQQTFTDKQVVQKVHDVTSSVLQENMVPRGRSVVEKPTMDGIVETVDLVCRVEAGQAQYPASPQRRLIAAIDRLIPAGATSAAIEASVQAFEQVTSGFQKPDMRPAHYVSPRRLVTKYRALLGEAASSRARRLFQEKTEISQAAEEDDYVDSLSAKAHAVFLPSASIEPEIPFFSGDRAEEEFPSPAAGRAPISYLAEPVTGGSNSGALEEDARAQRAASIKASATHAIKNYRPNPLQQRVAVALLKKKTDAAVEIQRIFRGFKARQQTTALRAQLAKQTAAATEIQRIFRGHVARTQFLEMKKAANTIAKTFKGYKARRDFTALKDATLKAQTLTRAYLARQQLAKLKAEHVRVTSAATTIQSWFRGYMVRKNVTQMEKAATRIQSIFRGHVARTQFLEMRDAANTIARSFKAFQARQRILTIQRDHTRQQALNLRTAEAFRKARLLRKVFASWRTSILTEKLTKTAPLLRSPLSPLQPSQRRSQGLNPQKLLDMTSGTKDGKNLRAAGTGSAKSFREGVQLPDETPSFVVGRVLAGTHLFGQENSPPVDAADQSEALQDSFKPSSAPSSPARKKGGRKLSHRRSHSGSLQLFFAEAGERREISPVVASTPPNATRPQLSVFDLSPIAQRSPSDGSSFRVSFSFDDTRDGGQLNAAVAEIVNDSMLPNDNGHLSVVDSMLADGHLSAVDESSTTHEDAIEDGSLPSGRIFSPLFRSLYNFDLGLPSSPHEIRRTDHGSFQVTEVLPSDRESVLGALSPRRPVYVECSAEELQDPESIIQRTLREVGNLNGAPIILVEKAALSQEISESGTGEGTEDSYLSQQEQAPVREFMPRGHSASALSSSRPQESLLRRVLAKIKTSRAALPKFPESSMLADGEAHLSPGAVKSGEASMLQGGHLSPLAPSSVDGSMMREGHLSAVDSMLADGEAHLSPGAVKSGEASMLQGGHLSPVAPSSVDGSMMREGHLSAIASMLGDGDAHLSPGAVQSGEAPMLQGGHLSPLAPSSVDDSMLQEGHLSAVDSMLSNADLSQVNSMLDGSDAHLSPVKGSKDDSMLASSAAHLSPTVQSPPVQVFVIRQ